MFNTSAQKSLGRFFIYKKNNYGRMMSYRSIWMEDKKLQGSNNNGKEYGDP